MEKKKSKRAKIYKDVKSFVVKRSKWFRGKGFNHSYLLRPSDGKMCCLGFYSLMCDLGRKDIQGLRDPSEAHYSRVGFEWKTKLLDKKGNTTVACNRLMTINDSQGIANTKREQLLTEQFAKLGIKVKFVD